MNKYLFYKEISSKIAKELDLPVEVVFTVIKSEFAFIRDKIRKTDMYNFEEGVSETPSFNLRRIGKLYSTVGRTLEINKFRDENKKHYATNGESCDDC